MLARGIARAIHRVADSWFGPRFAHRTLVLEALAGIPASVLAARHHLRSLRRLRADDIVRSSVEQAEHEHAHLLVFAAFVRPDRLDRVLLVLGQVLLLVGYGALVLVSERTAQRLAAYFEEEALESYDQYLRALVDGQIGNPIVPAWAVRRWCLPPGARLSLLVPAIEHDEMIHRDEHHAAADALALIEHTRRRARSGEELRKSRSPRPC